MNRLKSLLSDRARLVQFVKYLVIGGGTYLLELGLYSLFYYQFHLSAPVAKIPANVLAATVNFTLNGTLAFRATGHVMRSVMLYLALYLINLVFQFFAIALLVDQLRVPAFFSNLVTQTCVVLWNFVLYRKVVFR